MIWDCTPDKVGFSFLVVAWWIAVSPTTLSNLNFINSFLFFSKHPAPVKKEKKKDFKVNSIFLFSDYFVWVWKPVLQSCHKLQNWSWQTFDLPKFWNLVSFIWAAEWLFERFLLFFMNLASRSVYKILWSINHQTLPGTLNVWIFYTWGLFNFTGHVEWTEDSLNWPNPKQWSTSTKSHICWPSFCPEKKLALISWSINIVFPFLFGIGSGNSVSTLVIA